MHDDQPDPDDELAELISALQLADDETELSEHDTSTPTRWRFAADGSEVVTVASAVGSGQQWSVYMQPGGGLQNAYLGGQDNPRVWVDLGGIAAYRRNRMSKEFKEFKEALRG